MYSGSPRYSGQRRRNKYGGIRTPFGSQRTLSLSRKRFSLVWTTVFIASLIFLAQTVNLMLQGENEIFSEEDLQRILLEHGIANKAIVPEDLDWFRSYFFKLKRLVKKANAIEKSEEQRTKDRLANLNNLDMPMHKVNGTRVPCLDLLSDNEIARLDFPPPSSSPINELTYFRLDKGLSELGEKVIDPNAVQELPSQDLGMFSGKQTWFEREASFKLFELGNMDEAGDAVSSRVQLPAVHCGFCASNSGFDIDLEDRLFLESCRGIAVATCNFGGGDELAQPIGMLNSTLDKVCYVAFWDRITLEETEASGGDTVNPVTRKLGLWRVIVVQNLPFSDQRRNGKIPKMLTHRLFPHARYSVWVDAKSQFRRDPLGVLEALLWREPGWQFAISEHGARQCIFREGEAIVVKNKATPEEVAAQLFQYKLEGVPENITVNGQKALAEASVIIREHTPVTNLFMCLWFNEVVRFSARDQISFAYVLRRVQILRPNFFPVCTRKALVNNLGHRRKARVSREAGQTTKKKKRRRMRKIFSAIRKNFRRVGGRLG